MFCHCHFKILSVESSSFLVKVPPCLSCVKKKKGCPIGITAFRFTVKFCLFLWIPASHTVSWTTSEIRHGLRTGLGLEANIYGNDLVEGRLTSSLRGTTRKKQRDAEHVSLSYDFISEDVQCCEFSTDLIYSFIYFTRALRLKAPSVICTHACTWWVF